MTSSLFQAALEELNELKVEPKEELVTILPGMFQDVNYYGKIRLEGEVPECMISCDPLRLLQVIDNVISNSYKYAGTDIHVSFSCDCKELCIRIADEGKGVNKEDLPMICEKFYRGENGKDKEGSGLGLYISRKFMLKMGGHMEISNEDGFAVRLYLPLI